GVVRFKAFAMMAALSTSSWSSRILAVDIIKSPKCHTRTVANRHKCSNTHQPHPLPKEQLSPDNN
ncbi:MAG: hypothetical protein KJ883_16170, partial [Gammaproteobacteria bacterium]|nr:hypothetical protein [Gammaproteobacteria bacterium]